MKSEFVFLCLGAMMLAITVCVGFHYCDSLPGSCAGQREVASVAAGAQKGRCKDSGSPCTGSGQACFNVGGLGTPCNQIGEPVGPCSAGLNNQTCEGDPESPYTCETLPFPCCEKPTCRMNENGVCFPGSPQASVGGRTVC